MRNTKQAAGRALALCHALLSEQGEVSGRRVAAYALSAYQALSPEARELFFDSLVTDFAPDPKEVDAGAARYHADPSSANLIRLQAAVEPPRQELFRRANMAPNGTAVLLDMRRELLKTLAAHPERAGLDADLLHLFRSWFNRGFLVLQRIDWRTPAVILERLIQYEAVHEIQGWRDLRRRLESDRRCYAFFHPAMPDAPLIFVEVALTEQVPGAIAPLLAVDRQAVATERARTAVFYSISNTQRGLGGISFGNFLIKQVVEELRRELPKLDTFVTLSPVPGFMPWLNKATDVPVSDEDRVLLKQLDEPKWFDDAERTAQLRALLEPLAAYYFLKARTAKGRVIDPVARFHLGNGARLERINWLGDLSPKGVRESAGVMVNYLYRLDDIEKNHEAYANDGEVVASSAVKKLLKGEGRRLLDMRLS